MLRTLSTLLTIRTSAAANRFIYYAQKLPLIGSHITDNAYSNLKAKRWAAVIVLILSLLWGFFSKLAYMGLLVYLPVAELGRTLSKDDQLQLFFHIFIMLSFVIAGVTSASILEPKRDKYIAVKLMRLPSARYMQASLSYRYCMFFVYFMPAVFVFASLLDASFLQSVLLSVSLTLWRVFCEYLHLKLFDKFGTVLIKNNKVVWSVIGLGYAAAYLPLFFNQTPITGSLLLNLPVAAAFAALGIFAAVRLARYSNYRLAIDAATKRDDPLLNIGRMMSEAQQTSVRTKDSDYVLETLNTNKARSKEGYAYLNTLFFARHRSLITQPVYRRLAVIGALGVIGVILAAIYGQQASQTAFLRSNLGVVLPFLVITMNFLSIGEKVCRAMFYNCDLSLLRYSFYRSAADRHFRIRLYKIIGLNQLIAVALGAALSLVAIAAGAAVLNLDLLMLWVCVLSLSVFFSVRHLFMYYIFQPYSTELNVKNPLYYVVNMVVSATSGICIVVQIPSPIFSIIVLIVTLVYLIASLVLVRRSGHRTFRVK
ncbi:MAG: hypothetical protein K0Q73_5179 [Paenibacillus sp.]|nr:hypothetical protein [Paenibacillus sp.]